MDSLLIKPKKEPPPGFIYIFGNFINNNLIKVGLSKDPIVQKKNQLHTTGTELPMTIYQVWYVNGQRGQIYFLAKMRTKGRNPPK